MIGEFFRDHSAQHEMVGAQLALLVDGEVVAASTGLSDAEAGTPLSDDHTMPIASVTKPMVVTVAAQLVSEPERGLDYRWRCVSLTCDE